MNISLKYWWIWIGHIKIEKTLHSIFQMDSWKYFQKINQVVSGSGTMGNTMEITVLPLFDNLPLNIG